MNNMKSIAIIGTGPAALISAEFLSRSKHNQIFIFEKNTGPSKKLLIAGSSGLNITHNLPTDLFASHYSSDSLRPEESKLFWRSHLNAFSANDWIQYIETVLKQQTFLGTSNRYFIKEMKASKLVSSWIHLLKSRNVTFSYQDSLIDLESKNEKVFLTFSKSKKLEFDYAILALGGASYQSEPLSWVDLFKSKQIPFLDFKASNVGFEVEWPVKDLSLFLKEAEGLPLKYCVLQTKRGKKIGDLVITRYGIEGTPVYFYGTTGEASIDLLPDFSAIEIKERLEKSKENLAPIRRVKKYLNVSESILALLFHYKNELTLEEIPTLLKNYKIKLTKPRPIEEAISSSGGVSFLAVDKNLMLKKYPRIFCAGEMLDWDAPTGGFLIQGCVSIAAGVSRTIDALS
jgi:uncharacterized flavoprotein (TIGR03862 family)